VLSGPEFRASLPNMDGMLTIGKLAKEAGVPVSTVRYYEGRGLLLPDQRTDSSYRLFGAEALQKLRFIRAAQEAGFTLKDIAQLLALRAGEQDACGEVQGIIETRLGVLDGELARLQRVRAVLRDSLDWCRKPRSEGCCEAIARLDQQAAGRKPDR
jgi:MerR family transcriptional regulator, mercuric resistance operon regulatory protein